MLVGLLLVQELVHLRAQLSRQGPGLRRRPQRVARPLPLGLRGLAVTPRVAQNTTRRSSAIDGRTTRHPGYLVSQRERKRIEEIFGWLKQIGLLRKTRHRGVARVGWMFTFGLAVYHLIRMRNLATVQPI